MKKIYNPMNIGEVFVYSCFTVSLILLYQTFISAAKYVKGFIVADKHIKRAETLFAVTTVYFVVMAMSISAWTGYVMSCINERIKLRQILLWTGRGLAIVSAILSVVNIFVPVLFTVDESAVYQALSGRYIIILIQIIMLLVLSVYALFLIIKNRTEEKYKYRMLALFGIVMAIFLTVQLYFPYLPLYAAAYLLGVCLIHTYVLVDEKEISKNEMEEAKKISVLRQAVNSLLNNMPVNSYSKDVETGKYIACNQAFADYVRKKSPEEVIGLTDFDLFDNETASHFVEVDKIALGSDKPYIIYEDVTDVDGNPRQFQTTKLKFYDENGKLCLLGMSLDITEMVKAKKENEVTQAAYLEALNASTIYENIVTMLSRDYFDLYYIDTETDEYIEYGSKTEMGHRNVENRGENFFEQINADAPAFVFDEDLDKLISVLNKETLLEEIDKAGVFIYYYRLLIDGEPNYVSFKATRVLGDEKYIIIGVSNVDAQMKARIQAENAKEEKRAYDRLSAFSRNLMALYVVDTESEKYTEYNATEEFEELGIAKTGNDFFNETMKNSLNAVYSEDQGLFRYMFTKEKILNAIKLDGIFVMDYRLVIGGRTNYVRLKAAEVEEGGKTKIIIGIEDVDS